MKGTADTMKAAVQCHRAGRLGQAKRLYELVPHRRDSPWHRTMRLFRQNEQGDRSTVLYTLSDQLKT